jgi:S-methylmethionine-dependent homocysteine/selenocysteine methylase
LTLILSEEEEALVIKAQTFLKENPRCSSVRFNCGDPEEYAEIRETTNTRIGVTQIIVYSDEIYFYAQSKYDSHDQWEYSMLPIKTTEETTSTFQRRNIRNGSKN